MKRQEAIDGVRAIREVLDGVGGIEYAVSWSFVRDGWMIEVSLGWYGNRDARQVRLHCPVDDVVLRHVGEVAEEVAGARFVSDLAPWIRSVVDDLQKTCEPGPARELALTVIGDIESDRIPPPIVNGLSSGISLIWDWDDCVLELWFPSDQPCYHVISRVGDSPQSACVIVPSLRHVGDGYTWATFPEYVRSVMDVMFCDHECGGANYDGEEVLLEFGFTPAEIDAIDETAK